MKKKVRIFISSPDDVRREREVAYTIIQQFNNEFREFLEIEPLLWENLPLNASSSFQDGIDVFTSTNEGIDIAIFILWSKLGTRINKIREDGSEYESGTLYEFDTALRSNIESIDHKPEVLVYRCKKDLWESLVQSGNHDINSISTRINDSNKVEHFFNTNFYNSEKKVNTRAFHEYHDTPDFGAKIKEHIRALLKKSLPEVISHENLWKGCPYKGLEAFSTEDEAIFFGREKSVNEIMDKINYQVDIKNPFL